MDQISKEIRKTYSREQIMAMTPEEVEELLNRPGVEFHGKGVVRRPDGSIRYDADAVPGQYGESAEDMAKLKEQGNGR